MATEDDTRKRAVRLYQCLALGQFVAAVGSLMCSGLAVKFGDGDGNGIPYYAGGCIIGGLLLLSSLLAFRIYNKGPLITVCANARSDVTCAIRCHRFLSMVMFLGCVTGIAIVWMHGFCLSDGGTCSYDTNHGTNRALSIAIFCMGVVGVLSSVVSVYLFMKYGAVLGLTRACMRRGGVATQHGPCHRQSVQNHSELLRRIQANIDISEILREQLNQQTQLESDSHRYGTHGQSSTYAYDNTGFVPTEPPPPYQLTDAQLPATVLSPPEYSSLPTISHSVDHPAVVTSQIHMRTPVIPPPPPYSKSPKTSRT